MLREIFENTLAKFECVRECIRTSGASMSIDMYPQTTGTIEALRALWALMFFAPAISTEVAGTNILKMGSSVVVNGQF